MTPHAWATCFIIVVSCSNIYGQQEDTTHLSAYLRACIGLCNLDFDKLHDFNNHIIVGVKSSPEALSGHSRGQVNIDSGATREYINIDTEFEVVSWISEKTNMLKTPWKASFETRTEQQSTLSANPWDDSISTSILFSPFRAISKDVEKISEHAVLVIDPSKAGAAMYVRWYIVSPEVLDDFETAFKQHRVDKNFSFEQLKEMVKSSNRVLALVAVRKLVAMKKLNSECLNEILSNANTEVVACSLLLYSTRAKKTELQALCATMDKVFSNTHEANKSGVALGIILMYASQAVRNIHDFDKVLDKILDQAPTLDSPKKDLILQGINRFRRNRDRGAVQK